MGYIEYMGIRKKKILYAIMVVCMIVFGIFGTSGLIGDSGRNTDGSESASGTEEPQTEDIPVTSEDDATTEESLSEKTVLDVRLEQLVDTMTTEEKVGQLFFIKNDGRFKAEELTRYPAGGIILFAGDFRGETAETLTDKLQGFQEASTYPLLIGTDEEGGSVVRVSQYRALADGTFLSPRGLYNQGGFDAIREDTEAKSELLLSYGINVNFAPVCDLSENPGDFMYSRSFSGDAEETAEYVKTVVSVMKDKKIGSVLKHFPGYGENGDTHTNIIKDNRTYEQFVKNDFIPFEAGIDAGADCVLVSHNIICAIDDEKPASLSEKVHAELRETLGFDGVIITDDLMMTGVSGVYDEGEAAVQAVKAGNDMILSTSYRVQMEAVLQAVQDGEIDESRIDASVVRILKWKYKLGLDVFS